MSDQYFDSISAQIIHTLGCDVNKKAREINELRIALQTLRKKHAEVLAKANGIEVESKQLIFNHHEQSKRLQTLLETNEMLINELELERGHSKRLQKSLDKSKVRAKDLESELDLFKTFSREDKFTY